MPPTSIGSARLWTLGILALALIVLAAVLLLRPSTRGGTPAPSVVAPEPGEAPPELVPAGPSGVASRESSPANGETAGVEQVDLQECAPGTICGVVVTREGQPLAGAACSLFPGDAPLGLRFARRLRKAEAPQAFARSDGGGRFALEAPSGHWSLVVEHPGLRRWSEPSVPSGTFKRVVLDEACVLLLTCRDERGDPLADVSLALLDDPYSPPASAWHDAITDADGKARLEIPPGGSWFVQAAHPSHRTRTMTVQECLDGGWHEETLILAKGVRVRGVVLDPRLGRCPPGAEIRIDTWSAGATRAFPCDREGRFDTGPVFDPDDQLEVTARAPGYAEVRRVVELESAAVVDAALELELRLDSPEARVVGRVAWEDGLPTPAVDLLVQPFASGHYLEARKAIAPAVRWRPRTQADARGAFELDGLMANRPYQLLVLPRERFANALVRIPALEPGAVHDLGSIPLTPGGSLFGRARHEDGSPAMHLQVSGIAAIHLTLAQSRDPEYFPATETGRQDVYTSEDGRFEMALLPPGTRYGLYWGGKVAPDRHVGDYLVRAGEAIGPIDFVVRRPEEAGAGLCEGLVVDGLGRPIESVLVELWSGAETAVLGEGFVAGQVTDASGTFRLRLPSAGLARRLTATDLRGRFARASRAVEGSSEHLRLELEPGPTPPSVLEGVVTDAGGRPRSGIDLVLHLSPALIRCDCLPWRTATDEHGAFSFGLVAHGTHQVIATDRDGRLAPVVVPATPGSHLAIRME